MLKRSPSKNERFQASLYSHQNALIISPFHLLARSAFHISNSAI